MSEQVKVARCPNCGTPYNISQTETQHLYIVQVKCSFCDKTTRVKYPNREWMLKEAQF